MIKINPHISNMRPSDTLSINEYSVTLQKQGRKVYRFGFGQSPFPVPAIVQQALRDHAYQKDYLPVQGLEDLRNAVAQHTNGLLGEALYSPDQIFIGPGSKQLIFLLQLAHDGPLILPNPSWVSYAPQAAIMQKPTYWVDCETDSWLLSADRLESAILEDQLQGGMLILNYPNNPTGQTYSDEEFQEIASICGRYNITVIADEIYGMLNFENQYRSIAKFYPEGTLITSGLSKWCGAGGWRLGTMTFPDKFESIYRAMRTLSSETFSAVSAPVQYAGVVAYSQLPEVEEYVRHSKEILRSISTYVYIELSSVGVKVNPSKGGFYVFPKFNTETTQASIEFCKNLLKDSGVALLPGSSFGRPASELTARLAYVDFDGSHALQFMQHNDDLGEEAFHALFPRIVEGIQNLKSWVKNTQPVI